MIGNKRHEMNLSLLLEHYGDVIYKVKKSLLTTAVLYEYPMRKILVMIIPAINKSRLLNIFVFKQSHTEARNHGNDQKDIF